jgi:hypothetical protein
LAAKSRAERSSSRAQITQFWFAFWLFFAVPMRAWGPYAPVMSAAGSSGRGAHQSRHVDDRGGEIGEARVGIAEDLWS